MYNVNKDNESNNTIINISLESNEKKRSTIDYKQYNWVDIKHYAEKMFWNYSFEIAWAEDMWNILMFQDVVNSKSIANRDLNDFETGDAILWLISMHRLYYDFKVRMGIESWQNREELLETTSRIDDIFVDQCLIEYLADDIKIRFATTEYGLDMEIDELKNFDLSKIDFEVYEYEFEDALHEEVLRRKDVIISKIFDFFNNEYGLIIEFMQGIHWYNNYLNINNWISKKEDEIERKYERIMSFIKDGYKVSLKEGKTKYLFEDESDVENEMDNELRDLQELYYKNVYDDDTYNLSIWADGGMK